MERALSVLRFAEHVALAYYGLTLWRYVRRVGLRAALMKAAVAVVKVAPGGKALMAREQQKTLQDIKEHTQLKLANDDFGDLAMLPSAGLNEKQLLASMSKVCRCCYFFCC